MARNVPSVTVRRVLAALLLASFLLTGCGASADVPEAVVYTAQETGMPEQEIPMYAAGLVVDEGAAPKEKLPCEAAVLYGIDTGEVLFSEDPYQKLYPASVTKLFTVYTALKYGNLSDIVTVPEEARITVSGSSLCGVLPGDRMSLEDLLYGALFPSGNDACVAIAAHIGGSVPEFMDLMNEEVRRIGCTDTHLVTPNGLHDKAHVTTAYDIYLILQELAKDDRFLSMFSSSRHTAVYTLADGSEAKAVWTNTCKYLNGERKAPAGIRVTAAKTGTTTPAGYCLTTLAEDESGKRYITVVLKAKSRDGLYQTTDRLLEKIKSK